MAESKFSKTSFWSKIKSTLKTAGHEVLEKALWLYYAAQRPETPAWAKAIIYSALVYFILPVDAVPDAIPVVGYTDDLGVLAAAVGSCAFYINKEVKREAGMKLDDLGL